MSDGITPHELDETNSDGENGENDGNKGACRYTKNEKVKRSNIL